MKHQQVGSTHVVLIIVLVIALIGALGFIFWQNVLIDKSEPVSTSEKRQSTKENKKDEAVEQTGTIVGSLTYPSDFIPSDLEVHAVNLDTGKEYTTKDHLKGSQYQYGTGYSIKVPVGRYNVYGTTERQPGVKAYYNKVIVCGVKVECKDTTKIEVDVEANMDTIDATVGDWWTTE